MDNSGPARSAVTKFESSDSLSALRSKIITINVGGMKFSTTKATLVAEPGTYFDALIKSEQWVPDEDGIFFIDRNPRFFPAILDYLRMIANGREGMLLVGTVTPEEQRLLDDDIEYYMIGSLKRSLVASEHSGWKLDTRNMGSNLTMSEDCLTVTKTGVSGNCDSGVMGTHGFYDGTYRWRVILDAKESFWIFFGVSPVCYQDHPIHRPGMPAMHSTNSPMLQQLVPCAPFRCGRGGRVCGGGAGALTGVSAGDGAQMCGVGRRGDTRGRGGRATRQSCGPRAR